MAAFLGMRGTGDWATNEVPESWAQYIMREKPNGMMPLYAMQSMFGSETVDSHTYHWWTETLPERAGAVTSIYIDSDLGTEYVYATHLAAFGQIGSVVNVKIAAALAKEFVPGDEVILRDSDQLDVDVVGYVTNVVINGASSYLAVELNEVDDNHTTSASYNLATVDRIIKLATGYPEFSDAPKPQTYQPVEYDNYCEIFRNTFALSESTMAENLRTGDAYMEDKRRCVERHALDHEMHGWWGVKRSTTGVNGKPLRFTQGLIPFMKENNASNIRDYATETALDYAGKTWLQAGKKWLNYYLSQLFIYLEGEAMCWCGNGALNGIQELAEAYGDIQLKPGDKSYGLSVVEWITPHGKVFFKTHPLFSRESTTANLMVLGHPRNAKFAPKVHGGINRSSKFQTDMQLPGQDGILDGFIAEGGWKWYFPNQWMVLKNVGQDNAA